MRAEIYFNVILYIYTEAIIRIVGFSVVTKCRHIDGYRRFGEHAASMLNVWINYFRFWISATLLPAHILCVMYNSFVIASSPATGADLHVISFEITRL